MKWLSIDYIKQHSRIDYDCEDGLLEMYGDSAEDTVLNICNRTYDDIVEVYGYIPAPLYHAALILVDTSYTNREAVSMQQLYTVPYGFDMLIKPYMRLTTKTEG
jgi:uncharacterized phage protein (predicted DNA packaging)